MENAQRILVVEDSGLVAVDIEEQLLEEGYKVVGPASDLATAERLLNTSEIDAAILDINLDGEKVFGLADRLRARGIPFIFLTGYIPSDIVPEDMSGYPCLEKPFKPEGLKEKLSRIFN